MIDADSGWTFVPTTDEMDRALERVEWATTQPDPFPHTDDSDQLAPSRGVMVGLILGAMFWMALGLGWAAFRSWMR